MFRSMKLLSTVLMILVSFVSCGKDQQKSPGKSQIETPAISEKILNPDLNELAQPCPAQFRVKFETSKGDFVIEVHRDWAPHGADRLYYLARHGYYDGVRFFRVIDGFMAQFGYHGDPRVIQTWRNLTIPDDPVKQSNLRGYVTFAKTQLPNSRTTQLFINYGDNSRLDAMGFAPVGKVIEGMEVVDQLYSGYGEGAPNGPGPSQQLIQQGGNDYLNKNFPKLDYIKKATIL
ncbi:MAG: peptidylprolyl isomerase [candidate division KSB1 bacterium]|nr:peptidylprolyl isomerase [candidate division KSB1 bacterium]